MYSYLLKTAWREILRFPGVSALIVIAIALGLAATMSSATIVWQLGADPIPGKSDKLHYVMMDAWDSEGYNTVFDPPEQLTFKDSMAAWEKAPAAKQAPMYKTSLAVQPDRLDVAPAMHVGRATSRHFFELFEYPILEGSSWSAEEEREGALVVLISDKLRDALFGKGPVVGKELSGSGQRYRILGVYAAPKRLVNFHDVTNGPIERKEAFVMPLRTATRLELRTNGNTNCWSNSGDTFSSLMQSDCIWVQHWVLLNSAAEKASFQNWMDGYAAQQKQAGRFPRTANNNRLLTVPEHLEMQGVISNDARLAALIGWGFLLVSVVNATCLLLAKFLRGSRTSAIHIALGAARKKIFSLHLFQALILGLLAAGLGVVLTALSLWVMRTVSTSLDGVARMDGFVMGMLLLTSLIATLIAGVIPAWRVSRLSPAQSLRTN